MIPSIQHSSSEAQLILEGARAAVDLIFELDSQHRFTKILDINQGCHSNLFASFLGKRIEDLALTAVDPFALLTLAMRLDSGLPSRGDIVRLAFNEEERSFRFDIYPTTRGGAYGCAVDVSSEIEARHSLVEAQIRLNQAFEAMPIGLWLLDAHERLISWNSQAATLYPSVAPLMIKGTLFKELIEKAARSGDILDAQSEPDRWIASRLSYHQKQTAVSFWEEQLYDQRRFRLTETQLDKQGTLIIYEDITEQYERQKEFRLARDKAEAATHEKSSFLIQASHDLCQPLHALGLMIAAIENQVNDRNLWHHMEISWRSRCAIC